MFLFGKPAKDNVIELFSEEMGNLNANWDRTSVFAFEPFELVHPIPPPIFRIFSCGILIFLNPWNCSSKVT